VIKIVGTLPVGGSCNNSALLAGTPTLVTGLIAEGTTLHFDSFLPVPLWPSDYWFRPAFLSQLELNRLAYSCGVVANVGSGFGVCNSCRLGALGATAN
jgi:hypothetical protein